METYTYQYPRGNIIILRFKSSTSRSLLWRIFLLCMNILIVSFLFLSAHISFLLPHRWCLWVFCSHCLCFQPLSTASLPAPCTSLSQSFLLPKIEWYSLRGYAEVLTPGTCEHYLNMESSQTELLKSGPSSNMTDIQRGRWYEGITGKVSCDNGGRVMLLQGNDSKGCQQHQGLRERHAVYSSPEPSEKAWPSDPLISDLGPKELWDNKMIVWSHPVCSSLSLQPLEANITAIGFVNIYNHNVKPF